MPVYTSGTFTLDNCQSGVIVFVLSFKDSSNSAARKFSLGLVEEVSDKIKGRKTERKMFLEVGSKYTFMVD